MQVVLMTTKCKDYEIGGIVMQRFMILMMSLCFLAACGSGKEGAQDYGERESESSVNTERTYFGNGNEDVALRDEVMLKGISVGAGVGDVEEVFGEPKHVREIVIDLVVDENYYEYEYNLVHYLFSNNRVAGMRIMDEHAQTKRGIKKGDTIEDVRSTYSEFSIHVYENEQVIFVISKEYMLMFELRDEKVNKFAIIEQVMFEDINGASMEEFLAYMDTEEISKGSDSPKKEHKEHGEKVMNPKEVGEQEVEPYQPVEEDPSYTGDDVYPDDYILPEDLHRALHYSIREDDLERVKRLVVEYDIDVNELYQPTGHPSIYYYTNALHAAAEYGGVEMIKFMLEQGGDIEKRTHRDHPVLFTAIFERRVENALYLLERGANPHVLVNDVPENPANIEDSPLLRASRNGQFSVVDALIDKGVDVNSGNVYNETPMILATKEGYFEIAKLLYENGADPYAVDTISKRNVFENATFYEVSQEFLNWLETIRR